MHVIHLEDSKQDAELIRELLLSFWPECKISTLGNRASFEQAVRRGDFDLILSDYTLPDYDGLTALAFVQEHCPQKPFIYMSGTIGEERAIEALKAGASDYVIKDRPARLIPAVRAALTQVENDEARRRAEDKIREQASLLDKAHEAICVADPQCRITYWNASAEELYGWTPMQAIGSDLRQLLYSGDLPRFDAAYALVLAAREWRGPLSPRTSAGEPITVESSWSLVTDTEGVAKSILIIDEDVTEKQKIETQLMRAQRLETIGLLAGGIAHDLNNVLAPIITSIDLLRMRVTHPEDLATLSALEESAEHGADLVRQLLSFARGTGGQRVEISVDALIGSVHRLLQRAMPPTIEVRAALAPELCVLHADATQLRQVFLNLCLNARDAMPQGGVIEIRGQNVFVEADKVRSIRGEVRGGPHARISVADNGTGIPPEIVERIFDPFFTTKLVGKGTGLGLANVAAIIKSHGGFLDIESKPGEGTTFHVYLPALVKPAATEAVAVARPSMQGRGENILVVEDDEAIRTVLEVILNTRGYQVWQATDGQDGLSQLESRPGAFELVITDMNMPGVPGTDVVRFVRAMERPPKLVVMSGSTRDGESDPALFAGVEWLPKPLLAESLLSAVRRALDS